MTLRYDHPMVRLLIVPRYIINERTLDSRDLFKQKAPLCSNERALAAFVPFGFPIRGKYDDYGHIDNIVEDQNTKKLEEFFGASIYDLCNILATDDRWLRFGIERRDFILDKQSKNEKLTQEEEWDLADYKNWWKEADPKNINILKNITICDIRGEVYDLMIQPPKLKHKYYIEEYQELCSGYFKNLSMIKELNSENSSKEERLAKTFNFSTFHAFETFLPFMCKFNFLKELQIDESFQKEYVEMVNFIYSINSYRKLLLPTLYGSQEDNYKDLLELTKLTQSLLKANIKRFNDYK